MFRPDILNEFRALAGKADAEWIQRKWKINTETLIVELARGKVNRMGLRQIASQKPGNFSASALVQAKQRIPVSVMAGILSKLNESAFSGRRVLAIDSTKINLPLRFKAQGVAPRNAAAHKPLIMCSTLFNIKADIPLEVIIANHHDERGCLLFEHTLQAGDLVIGDRGYFGQKLCAQLKTRGVDVLLRVKEKACLPVMSFVASRRKERVMDLDGVRVKCFKYAVEHQRYVLVTTNLTMTMSEARTLYKSRWRIEEGFRRWKSDFHLCKNVSHSLHTFQVDVLSVAISHALVRRGLSSRHVVAETPILERSHMISQEDRAFRASALALFPLVSTKLWSRTGIWIKTRRAKI